MSAIGMLEALEVPVRTTPVDRGTIPLWWAWTVLLSNEVWQHEFMRLFGEEEIPMPRFRELYQWGGAIHVIERVHVESR